MILKRKQLAVRVGQACTAIAIAAASQAVLAQEPTQRVEVTGSSIKQALGGEALPVQVITRDEISKSGAVNIESLIQSLPSVSIAGSTTKSMGAGLSSYGQSSVSLRGLGDNRTLVLINGRRMAPFGLDSAAVDINAIPMEAIERIDVLTDGASSIYGSDAMAGVINFILRKDFEGIELNADFGAASRSGGGDTDKWSIVLGKGNLARDKFNFMLTGGMESQERLRASDRDFSRSGNVLPFYSNGATGGGNIEGVWNPALGNTRASQLATGPNAGPASGANPLGIADRYYGSPQAESVACNVDAHFLQTSPAGTGVDPRFPSTSVGRCTFDSAPYANLIPTTNKKNVSASFTIQLNPSTQFYGAGSWVTNQTISQIQPSPVRTSFLVTDTAFTDPTQNPNGVAPALLIHPLNPNYPTAWLNSVGLGAMVGQVLAVTQRAFVAGNRTTDDNSTQTRMNLGFKGDFMGWDYDTAVSRDQSAVKGRTIDGYFSQLGLAIALNGNILTGAGNTWNPWAPAGVQDAATTAAVAAAKYNGPTAGGVFTRTGWDGRISKAIGKMAGGEVGLAVGAEFRKEQLEITSPAILESGDIAGLGGGVAPMKQGRNVSSVFGEVVLPFLSNLEANLSVRGDKYSDLVKDASPVTGKVSAKWTPVQSVVTRASYGTGFRAPSLLELYQPTTLGTTEQFDDLVAGVDYQANALNGGNPTLVPEESKQWSIGAVIKPMKNVSVNVDYFAIEIDKYVTAATASALVTQARAASANPLLPANTAFVTFTAQGAPSLIDQRSINAGLAKFAGFDIGASWSDKFAFGKLGVDYNATRMTKAQLTTPDGTEDGLGTQIDNAGNTLKLTGNGGAILKYKHKLSVNWELGSWGATLTQNYTDGYRDGDDLNGARHDVPSYSIYDAQIQFNGIKGLKLAIGAKNLLDKDPPLYINTTNFFQYGYDPALYDPLGRFVYVKATYKF